MAISGAEADRLRELDRQVQNGSILTFDGLETILRSCDFDAEKIGRHFLEAYWKQKKSK